MPRDLEWLNALPEDAASKELMSCCGSQRWTRKMLNSRPFDNLKQLKECAEDVWWKLDSVDWLEAFRSHPKIGEKKPETSTSQRAQQWSGQEQSGVQNASRQTLDAIAELNREYEAKFGYIFIVCASGKSSEEMLAMLRQRLENDPDDELRIAAGEQAKITELRLAKLVA